jgi:hypothetical protein
MAQTKKARQAQMKARQATKTTTGITAWDVVKADRPDWNHNGGERRNLVIKVDGDTVTLLPFTTTCKGLEMWMAKGDGRDQNGNLVTGEGWTTTLGKVQKMGRLDAEQQTWVNGNL